ncbi:hypothetical protein SPICUR_04000 [Spiribacter curvatus]|uniref:Transcriptional activator HlyU n=2 Tax=Spiribacter curvatus TaxID=1335757 RepID=U5T6H7_9GAMM|nr:hypothetical protein SPICUR_04000 [Spiribacter curvatus]
MIIRFLRSMMGRNGGGNPPAVVAETTYQGYTITATPSEDPGGWRVRGQISTTADGSAQSTTFVRADVYGSQEVAAEMTLAKARRLIDEQGSGLFQSPH